MVLSCFRKIMGKIIYYLVLIIGVNEEGLQVHRQKSYFVQDWVWTLSTF